MHYIVYVYAVALAKLKIILSAPAPWDIHGVVASSLQMCL